MSNYYYTGVTAYIQNNPQTNANLRLLAEAIFQMQPYIGLHEDDFSKRTDITSLESFRFISKNDSLFTNQAPAFPQHTPENYQSVDLSTVTVKGNDLVRLYIPVISEDQEEVNFMVDEALVLLFNKLFGDSLVAVKAKSGCDWDDFTLIPEDVLVSANRYAAAA